MIGGRMTTTRFAIAAVATALMGTSALAADLGGNCCADLEERIAELEATTVRKGNKKVSVTLSGWVVKLGTWLILTILLCAIVHIYPICFKD